MDINYYSARRKLAATSLLSLGGVVPNDLGEILAEAKRLETMSRFKERTDFLQKQCVLLYTDELSGLYRVVFESAVTFSGGNTVVMPIDRSKNLSRFIENVRIAGSLGALATFVNSSDARYVEGLSTSDGFLVNASDVDSPVSVLSALYALREKYGRLKGLKVAYVGNVDEKTSSTAIALAKCETALTVIAPKERAIDKGAIEYLSQFTDISCADSLEKGLKDCDAIFTTCDFGKDFAITDEVVDNLGGAYFFGKTEELTQKAEERRKEIVFEKAKAAVNVTRAILSLLTEK